MIPYGRQSIDQADIDAVAAVLRSDWLTTGPAVRDFEAVLCQETGATHCVTVTSGTAALHTAYAAAGIGSGDEIITPPITFVATQSTAVALGAVIRFADVQADTANLDPEAVAKLITERTKAIVAVDYAGHPADLNELRELADANRLILIEDAAHSLGSTYRGLPVGSIADITTFSFFPTKNITTGEGGGVLTDNEEFADRARRFRNHGLVRDSFQFKIDGEGPWHQEVHEFGLNYRLPDILAALGKNQLRRLGEFKARRAGIVEKYNAAFCSIPGLSVPARRDYVDPMWHLYPLRIKDGSRRQTFEQLRDRGVGAQVNYIPVYWHPVFQELGYKRGMCPAAEVFYDEEISLPLYPGMTDIEVEFVIESVLACR